MPRSLILAAPPNDETSTLRPHPDAQASLHRRLHSAQRDWRLTTRQLQVLTMLALGHANKEIAAELRCSEVTVEYHVTALLRRSGADRRGLMIAKLWLELQA